MALAPAKKKKIIRIIIILSGRTADFLEAEPPEESSVSEAYLDSMIEAKATLYDFPADPSSEGSKAVQDCWAEVEYTWNELETGSPTEGEIETMRDSFIAAYNNV